VSPFERLHGTHPDYNFLRVFGCAVWPNLRPYNSRKLEFRSKRCVFIGYSTLHKGYRCLDPKVGRVYISRDVVFDEHVFPFASLHPNAGALLRKELELLPDILCPLSSRVGERNLHGHNLLSPNGTNGVSSDVDVQGVPGSYAGSSDVDSAQNGAVPEGGAPCHFMCSLLGSSSAPEEDPAAVGAGLTVLHLQDRCQI
jgi:histone deacetylase 1/2